jgi:hypothetical protein
MNELVDLTE